MVDEEKPDAPSLVPRATRAESAMDIGATISSAVPWIGGPVSAVLSGMARDRKIGRVYEVLACLAAELRQFRSQVSEEYVKTEDFEDLLERVLRLAADERNLQKRRIYAAYLADAVKSPGESYDEQIRFLRTLEELQPDHLRVMKALSAEPEGGSGISGSPGATLEERLPDMDPDRIEDLVTQLNGMRLTSLGSLHTMMTFSGAQELRGRVTEYGRRFLTFILHTDTPESEAGG